MIAAPHRASRRITYAGFLLALLLLIGACVVAYRNQRVYQQTVAAVLDAAQQPGSVAAILTPDGGAGSGVAAITAGGDVTMALRDLAPTSGAQVYQAWVIGPDGVPQPLGSFQVGRDGTASLNAEAIPAADGLVLALTLEPGPGVSTPTLPIISKGVATSAG